MLAQHKECSPGFDLQHHIIQAWGCTPKSEHLRGGVRSHPQLQQRAGGQLGLHETLNHQAYFSSMPRFSEFKQIPETCTPNNALAHSSSRCLGLIFRCLAQVHGGKQFHHSKPVSTCSFSKSYKELLSSGRNKGS